MTSPLDEKGLKRAKAAVSGITIEDNAGYPAKLDEVLSVAIRAYLSATALPDGLDVVAWRVRERPGFDWRLVDGDPDRDPRLSGHERQALVRISQAQSALAAMRVELEDAWAEFGAVPRDKTLAAHVKIALDELAGYAEEDRNRAETAEAQVKRLTEEKEALSKELAAANNEFGSQTAEWPNLWKRIADLKETSNSRWQQAEEWQAACMEAREGCNQRSEVIRKWIIKGETQEARIKALEEALRGILVNPDKTSRAAARAILTQESDRG